MGFLKDIEDRGYPSDYLFARVRGRSIFLISEWDNALLSPDISEELMSSRYREFLSEYSSEGIRKRYLKELHWIYYQMNRALREIFLPYFICSELETLLVCLRYKTEKGKSSEIEDILEYSLLSEKIINALKTEAELPAIMDMLTNRADILSVSFSGLRDVFFKDGLAGAEHRISAGLFDHLMKQEMHPVMRRFIVSVIDSKNIISLYKHIHWETDAKPVFIEGGSISMRELAGIERSHDISDVYALIYKQTGSAVEGTSVMNIDTLLMKVINRQTKKLWRESPDIGLVLSYLWSFNMESRNLSILCYAHQVGKGAVREELVY